jgi:EAL domain-containing protein (putative c-di-GMP-specific phosphodiesterase class I)
MARVLVVDDDAAVLKAYGHIVSAAGHEVVSASDGAQAIGRIREAPFDVVVSDIAMPGMTGLDLLRRIRANDLDVPVILMTGAPATQSAIEAVEHGAFRYLVKPVDSAALVEAVSRAARFHKLATLKRQALGIAGTEGQWLGDRASLEARFDSALSTLWMAYQPIVCWSRRHVHGFEALVRNEDPLLARPDNLLKAAERLGRIAQLGRVIRGRVAEALPRVPDDVRVFVNLHAWELRDDELSSPNAPLSRFASRVVLEITERASLDEVKGAVERVAALRGLGYRIAIDDLGAGYAGLTSFATLAPDVIKLDMSLVRGINEDLTKQSIVRSMVALSSELGMEVVAEGVETAAERDVLVGLGCDLFQGFLFAKPGLPFPEPTWN